MRLWTLASLPFLTACAAPTIEYVYVTPDVPAATLQPCPISDRRVQTVKELAVLAAEHRRSAECANGKIEAVADILGAE